MPLNSLNTTIFRHRSVPWVAGRFGANAISSDGRDKPAGNEWRSVPLVERDRLSSQPAPAHVHDSVNSDEHGLARCNVTATSSCRRQLPETRGSSPIRSRPLRRSHGHGQEGPLRIGADRRGQDRATRYGTDSTSDRPRPRPEVTFGLGAVTFWYRRSRTPKRNM